MSPHRHDEREEHRDHDGRGERKGISLAKGPIGLLGLLLLAYGISALLFGDRSFTAEPLDGAVSGETWLGIEVNGWSSLLFAAAGALLLLSAPLHWGAKATALTAGLALGAASLLAIGDGDDALGVFAANGLTKLVWGAAGVALLVLSLLPRVGKRREEPRDRDAARVERPMAVDNRTGERVDESSASRPAG